MSERCDLTDLLVTDCAHCKEASKATEASWAALYPGTCATCGVRFDEGRMIKWRGDGEVQHAYHQ